MGRTAEILLVEDDDTDALLTCESIARTRCDANLHRVDNGEKCLAFLRKQGEFTDAPTPDLILLDVNLPVMTGREALVEIVADENLCHLPVVVLTTSNDTTDVQAMYRLRCSAYVQKPIDFKRFREIIQRIIDHWFTLVVLP